MGILYGHLGADGQGPRLYSVLLVYNQSVGVELAELVDGSDGTIT